MVNERFHECLLTISKVKIEYCLTFQRISSSVGGSEQKNPTSSERQLMNCKRVGHTDPIGKILAVKYLACFH